MNNLIKTLLLFFVAFVIGAAIIVAGFLWEAPQNTQVIKPFFPKTYFSLANAPTDSLKGEVASMSGKVGWMSRTANLATLITSDINLQQGEEIDTYDSGEATLDFPKVGTIGVSNNSQISIIQTLPQNFVIWQKQGEATYYKNGDIPVSIVVLDLLINIQEGNATISLDKKTSNITININLGTATVAYEDLSGNTNVVTLKSPDTYIFNDNLREGTIY